MADRPLRIIHCFRSPVGGVFRHVRDLIEDHVKAGHEVGILCDSLTGSDYENKLFAELEPKLALGLTRIPIRRSIMPSDILALSRAYFQVKDLKPDVIHGHSAKGGAIARIIGTFLRANGQKTVRLYSPHGGSLHYNKDSLKGRLFFITERFLERVTDAICFVCDYEKRTYISKIGQPLPLYRTIYNGVREEEFQPIALQGNAKDFLYIGMMRDLKGPQIVIEAVHQLKTENDVITTVHMVGDGPDKQRYKEQIKTLGLDDQILVHDAMPARTAFAMARTVIIPSLAEAMPYIVLEASAAGKAIIATNVGGIPEILGQDNKNLIPPGNVAAMARAMLRQKKQPCEAPSCNMDDFKSKFSSSAMSASMAKLYDDLCNQ